MAASVEVPARDGVPLAGTLFAPPGAPVAAVVINSATAVPQGYYAAFAEWLAGEGFAVLTYDYRGVGGSRPRRLRGFKATMRAWGEEDVAGAVAFLERRFPGLPLLAVGHSAGGWLLGFTEATARLAGVVTVATQSGWWGHWPYPARLRRFLDWHLLLPAVAHAWGYLPGRLGIGEDLPKGVALEWARWNRDPRFVERDGPLPGFRSFPPACAWRIEDDRYAPEAAVDAFVRMLPGGVARRTATRAEAGGPVGHFGFFRPRSGRAFWPAVAAFLLDAAMVGRPTDVSRQILPQLEPVADVPSGSPLDI